MKEKVVEKWSISKQSISDTLSRLKYQRSIYDSLLRNNYLRGYVALNRHFSKLDLNNYDDVLVGAYAVYGWMPTVLKYPPSETAIEKLVHLVLAGREQGARLNLQSQMQSLQSINNSVVGTSKFLHFAAPNVFPIWDSVVASAFGLNRRHIYATPESYGAYFEAAHAWCEDSECEFPQTYLKSIEKIDVLQNATRLRLLELALFTIGKLKR